MKAKSTKAEERSHAERNGDGWMSTIRAYVAALDHDFDDDEPCEIDGDTFESSDQVRERIGELPLSVRVRSGWANVGEKLEAEEYEILLSTGGPALRIVGDLTAHNEPETARLEHQDWGTPWTELRPPADTPVEEIQADDAALLRFAQQFYFGG